MKTVAESRPKRPTKKRSVPPPAESGTVPIVVEPIAHAGVPERVVLGEHHRIINSIDIEVAEYAEEMRLALLQIAFDLRHLDGEALERAVAYNALECLRLADAVAASTRLYKVLADDEAARVANGVAA